ncbi:MAG: hypothetical protein ABI402_17935 [Ferruginibacter sp.]
MSPKSFLIIFFPALILVSCSGNSSTENKAASGAKTTSPDTKTESSDKDLTGTHGIFSYTVKGVHVVARNYVQQSNLFINEVTNDAANGVLKIEVTPESSSVFNFNISNSGTTTITNYNPSLGNFADKKSKKASYMEGKTYKQFYGDSVTVTITSINDNRVTGTFSGTFKADADDGGGTLSITDGSFNLPFGKS